jgi:hypothetical protein
LLKYALKLRQVEAASTPQLDNPGVALRAFDGLPSRSVRDFSTAPWREPRGVALTPRGLRTSVAVAVAVAVAELDGMTSSEPTNSVAVNVAHVTSERDLTD